MEQARSQHGDRARVSINGRITRLVLICVLPGWLLASLLSVYVYQQERENMGRHALDAARALLRIVERDMHADLSAMIVLATSRRLNTRNLSAFYRKAREILPFTSGFTIVLSDSSGQQVINLMRPYGSPLPPHGSQEVLQRVFETRKPVISDLFQGSVSREPLVSIAVPVVREGKVLYGLSLGIDPKHLSELLRQQRLPAEWVISIMDSSGTIVARDRAGEAYIGRKATPALLERLQVAQEGMLDSQTHEGIAVLAAFSRSTTLGWSVAIGVPEAVLTAGLKRSLALYGFGAAALLLAGLWLASRVGRRISKPVQDLIQPALAIGRGETVTIPPLGLTEADEVAQAMLEAQELLLRREEARAQAVAELRESEAQFRATFDISSVGMCETDPQTRRFLRVNRHLCEMTGYAEAELLAKTFVELTHPDDRDDNLAGMARLLRGEIPEYRSEKRYVCKDGSVLWCDLTVNAVLDASGTPELTVAVLQDIGAYKRAQQDLSEAKAAAEQASRAKSTFLANMSHEIRTPLHNIIGLAEMLRRDATDLQRRRRLDDLCSSSEHLLSVINGVLDVSKIEADRLVLDQSDFSLDHVLGRVMSVVAGPAREKGLNLVLDVMPLVRGALLQGDAVRLGQVLINLVANAIKFSDHGSITLNVTCLDETANDLSLRFSITDEGIGISANDKERLFSAFEQGDNSSNRRHGGSGLGLTISDRLVRAMGGAIQVESQPGAGSVFSFEIQFARGSRPDDEADPAEPRRQRKFSGSHLLLAEDHPLSAELMLQMLSEFDCSVDLARDGAEAVERARARAYDLILMDVQMPKLDGLEATRAIRKLPGHERTPILAVTANIFVEDREQCFQAGMNGHLSKPLTPASLARALGRWLAESLELETADDARIGCLDQEKESADGLAATAMLLGAVGQGLTREYILREFLRLHCDDPARVRAHLADGDIDSARKLVHNLEGASAMVGAQKLRTAVAGLGAALRAGMDKSVVDARLAACEAELALLEDASPTEL
jgi:PAS domain S-box-containing protein